MNTAVIREQLHEYIEHADDKHVEAIYVLLEKEIGASHQYDEATLAMFHKRREDHLNSNSTSYTPEESLKLIRAAKK